MLLGPPLADGFFAPRGEVFFPSYPAIPEGLEHARYALALLGPALLSAAIIAPAARRIELTPRAIGVLTWAGQLALVAFLAACFAAENDIVLHTYPAPQRPNSFFNLQTLLIAAALPALLLFTLRRRAIAEWLERWTRETRAWRVAGIALACALAALWIVTDVDTDDTIANSFDYGWIQIPVNETFAVLDGRTPLVDYHAPYGQLISYPPALTMALLGATLLVWTATMAAISWSALVAVYATFRRVLRGSAPALALYLPFLAITFFVAAGTRMHRFSPAGIFPLWPIRYAGPYLVVWLLGRHLDALRPRRAWLLFLAAGLVALNNPEFGAGAFVGTLLALACQRASHSRASAARLLGSAAAGLGGALALVGLLTLVRAGQLPRLELLTEYGRVYGLGGWHLQPMHSMGYHTAAYVTFAGEIVVAVVRAARAAEDRLLTGLLAWSGGFGLLAGSYYVGESEPGSMLALFSAWFFALALLTILVARSLAARGWRRPRLVELVILFGFGISLDAIHQIPFPWLEAQRLQVHAPVRPLDPQADEQFVASVTRPGEHVALFLELGNRVAYDLGLVNVSPYLWGRVIPTRGMMRATIEEIRAARVRKLFIDEHSMSAEQFEMLQRAGFVERGGGLLVDARTGGPGLEPG
jgi:hypothetical protein